MTASAIAERPNAPAEAVPTPLTMLQRAIDANIDPDRLEKLMALYERWERNQAERAFSQAMNECQKAMKPVERKAWNSQTKSHYAALDAIHEDLKPIWLDHGFSLSHGSDESPLADHYRAVCDVMHDGGHTRRYQIDGPCDDKGFKGAPNKTPIQGVCSTMSYLQRKLECMIFDVTIKGEDKDGNGRGEQMITVEQEIQIRELIEAKEVKLEDFLGWGQIEKISDLPARMFPNAISMLQRRQAGAKR